MNVLIIRSLDDTAKTKSFTQNSAFAKKKLKKPSYVPTADMSTEMNAKP